MMTLPHDGTRHVSQAHVRPPMVPHVTPKVDQETRLETELASAFDATGYPTLKRLKLVVCDRTVTLTGNLDSFYLCQIAQTVAMKTRGVDQVINEIHVPT